jgi:hypothetical protein
MAYQGTTAASTASNPPRVLVPNLGGLPGSTQLSTGVGGGMSPYRMQGGALWFYSSSDPHATVSTGNYFTDGQKLGMRVGDVVLGLYWTTQGSSVEIYMNAIKSVTTAGASFSTSATLTST